MLENIAIILSVVFLVMVLCSWRRFNKIIKTMEKINAEYKEFVEGIKLDYRKAENEYNQIKKEHLQRMELLKRDFETHQANVRKRMDKY